MYRQLDHYVSVTRMYCDGAWGGDPEIQTLAALLNTTIFLMVRHFMVGLDLGAMKCMA